MNSTPWSLTCKQVTAFWLWSMTQLPTLSLKTLTFSSKTSASQLTQLTSCVPCNLKNNTILKKPSSKTALWMMTYSALFAAWPKTRLTSAMKKKTWSRRSATSCSHKEWASPQSNHPLWSWIQVLCLSPPTNHFVQSTPRATNKAGCVCSVPQRYSKMNTLTRKKTPSCLTHSFLTSCMKT